jgi:diguanylate cyclase (GGDEF)-like protein
MNRNPITVFSGREDFLVALRERCPDASFSTADESRGPTLFVIHDSFRGEVPQPGRSRLRIFVGSSAGEVQRPFGDLHVGEEDFLQHAGEYLSFAQDFLVTISRTNDLEQEVDLFAEVRDLMMMADLDPVFERITTSTLNLLKLGHGSLFAFDPRLERFVAVFSNEQTAPDATDAGEHLPEETRARLDRGIAGQKPYVIEGRSDGTTAITIPIQVRDDLIGFFAASIPEGQLLDEDLAKRAARYLRAVTGVIANVHQLTSSKDLAMRDDLTKAFNRRFFDAYLDEEIERARRYGSVLSIIFLDLDDLKVVNNKYGHLMGSRVLQEVAKRILGAVRGIDKVVRFGGDEFCIILPQTDQQQASNVANRVRKALSDSTFLPDPDIEIPITASFGIATFPYHGLTKEDLIRQADDAMYRVKTSTKNAIGLAGDFESPRAARKDAG